ncbi:hypothetical protein [Actinoallomurus iriomotensis]|nr:hypothetical protein [Actinoallomurus iriomotensis]
MEQAAGLVPAVLAIVWSTRAWLLVVGLWDQVARVPVRGGPRMKAVTTVW